MDRFKKMYTYIIKSKLLWKHVIIPCIGSFWLPMSFKQKNLFELSKNSYLTFFKLLFILLTTKYSVRYKL